MSKTFPSSTQRTSRYLKASLGYLFALACLVWVFHDVHFDRLLSSITSIQWGWVALAIACDIFSYVCQGLRWQFLLRPIGNLSVLQTTQAIYAGLFASEVLPMRVGELVRTYLISRWISMPFLSVLPSIAVERFFDAVWLAVAIGLTAIFFPLPKDLLEAGDLLGIMVLATTALFIFLVVRQKRNLAEPNSVKTPRWKLIRGFKSFFAHLAGGLRSIGFTRFFYLAFGFSLLLLFLQILALWFTMLACGISVSLWAGAVVLLIVHLGTAIPNAPANVGTYQFFCVVGLTLFGVDKTTASSFSLVAFVLLTIPLWVLGVIALGRSGMTLSMIRREIRTVRRGEN